MVDQFLRRKQQQLSKSDRSLKQSWDKKILTLCEKINNSQDYYTTSSCSGRALILVDSKEKRDDLFIEVWHDLIKITDLKKAISKTLEDKSKSKELVYFKQDPCILHVACKTLEKAQKLHDLAKLAGWKRCGIITSNKRFVVELNATDRLEFPIINKGKLLVNDDFLEIVIKESNKKLKLSWEKINKLEKSFKL
ncbi:MAG TPA: hypothetical protein P5277_01905 [Candidatus Paceibacterota bacterium]|nr:hypothetical protein [Candidatus Paceibacterota bacterium]